MTVEEAITKLKREWSQPRDQLPVGELEPMVFACSLMKERALASCRLLEKRFLLLSRVFDRLHDVRRYSEIVPMDNGGW